MPLDDPINPLERAGALNRLTEVRRRARKRRLERRGLVVGAAVAAAAVVSVSLGALAGPSKTSVRVVAPPHQTTTTTTATTTTTPPTTAGAPSPSTARAEAVLACETFNSPTSTAVAMSQMLGMAASDARSAAQSDPRWQPFAAELTQYAGLPETGNTPAQETEGTQDKQAITSTCSTLTRSALPTVFSDCNLPPPQPLVILPDTISLACADAGLGVEKLSWQSWTDTGATGTGTLWQKNCVPDCPSAPIPFSYYSVTVTLSGVITNTSDGRLFTSISVVYDGKGPQGEPSDVYSLPLPTEAQVPGTPSCDANSTWSGVEPTVIAFGCTTDDVLRDVVWTTWTATEAVGTAVQYLDRGGSATSFPVRVVLSNPGHPAGLPAVFQTIAATPTSGTGTSESATVGCPSATPCLGHWGYVRS